MFSQIAVIFSNMKINQIFGKQASSKKKMSDDKNKKIVKKGAKTKLPIIESDDTGKPHHTKIGILRSVRKNCIRRAGSK